MQTLPVSSVFWMCAGRTPTVSQYVLYVASYNPQNEHLSFIFIFISELIVQIS